MKIKIYFFVYDKNCIFSWLVKIKLYPFLNKDSKNSFKILRVFFLPKSDLDKKL
jgi:hypothetical protein